MTARRRTVGRFAATAALCLAVAAGAARGAELELTACGPIPSVAAPVDLSIEPAGEPSGRTARELSRTVDLTDGTDRLPLAFGPGEWRVELRHPAFWAGTVTVEDGAAAVPVPLWPRTALAGRVRVPHRERPPRELRVTLQSAGESQPARAAGCALPTAEASCALGKERQLLCPLPAGAWHLRLGAPGWAPHRLWNRSLETGATLDLGTVILRRGATLVGEVTTTTGPVDAERTRLWAVSVTEADGDLDPAALAASRTAWSAEMGPRGDFVFHDLPPGRFLLVAHQEGLPLHDLTQVTLEEGEQKVLRDPIVLARPMRLVVELAPPTDPFGRPWTLDLSRESRLNGRWIPVASGPASGGIWRAPDLRPGSYYLQVEDSRDDLWLTEGPITLGPWDGPEVYLPIAVEVVEVSGAVRLGEDDLPGATLWFGGRAGMSSIEVTADEEGRYRAALPWAGEWEIEVEVEEPPVTHRDQVDVPERGGRLDVELPDTRLAGRVVHADGSVPERPAQVTIFRLDDSVGSTFVRARDDGGFETRGIAVGQYLVYAAGDDATSEMVNVDVSEHFDPPELSLVLRAGKTVEGTVTAADGGVAGAEVLAVPFSPTGRVLGGSIPMAFTGPSGGFELDLPREADSVQVTVLAPGYGFHVSRRPVDDLTITVSPAGGSLWIPTASADSEGRMPVVYVDGLLVGFHELTRWAALNGVPGDPDSERMRIPAMPPGVYRYCLVRLTEALALLEGRALPTRRSEGVLAPGGELTLTLP